MISLKNSPAVNRAIFKHPFFSTGHFCLRNIMESVSIHLQVVELNRHQQVCQVIF